MMKLFFFNSLALAGLALAMFSLFVPEICGGWGRPITCGGYGAHIWLSSLLGGAGVLALGAWGLNK